MPRLSFKKFETDYPPSSVAEYIVEFIWNKIVRPKEATYLFLIHSATYLSLEITNLLIAIHYHIYTFHIFSIVSQQYLIIVANICV